ncbi:MAG TPA: CoA transferase, partial [Phenylobacterium sp.]|uniref:CoA transferase n=1 Tax=Phenylobacterium sp. TaxID=1871053 RepID=UPI002D3E2BF4
MTSKHPLSGLRVVELSRGVAAAYCARQFAAWGADVAMLEPAEGSPIRRLAPFARGAGGAPRSLAWAYMGANKRAVAEDSLAEAGGLADLLARADVFVTDLAEEALAPFGVSLAGLAQSHPELCAISITPFGLSGPYAGFAGGELVVQALSGYLASNGEMGRPPLRLPGHIGAYLAGVSGFVGGLAARYGVMRGAAGDLVEVSEMETLSAITPFLRLQYFGGDKVRGGGPETGVRLLPCRDGHVSLLPLAAADHAALSEVLEIPEGAIPEAFAEGPPSAALIAEAVTFFSAYTRRKTRDEIFHGLEARGVACGRLQTPGDLVGDDHLAARGFFRRLEDPDLGTVPFPGPAARLAASDIVPPAPAPRTRITAGDLGWDVRAEPVSRKAPGAPLQGVRIVDFTQAWIGPFATMLFGDLGAEVVKIESHKRP